MKAKLLGAFTLLIAIVLVFSLSSLNKGYYEHVNSFKSANDFPDTVNSLFAGSGKCVGCHGYDPEGLTSTDEEGNDVNVSDAWAATMMANAAKDPFWRAKVSHEVAVNPDHQEDLESTCTKCHAPLGNFNAIHNGASHYSIAEMEVDSLALDGVSCSACHQLDTAFIGQNFSGQLVYDTTKTIFGPYQNPFTSPMQGLVGFDVAHDPKISTSLACASCHTLITQSANIDGDYTGTEFVEQATYHEWTNSIYDQDETRQECQACHVPRIEDEVALALDYSFIGGRSPFGKHEFSGANIFMLKLMQNNIEELGINASSANYDSAITRTERLLRDCTLVLHLEELNRSLDSVYYSLDIKNKVGHKFPSGYPSRRASVQFIVKNEMGDTLFFNGEFDEEFEVIGHSTPYESHHTTIRNEEDVQIYEMVFADSEGNKSTILERGYSILKDNRIVPAGFTNNHFAYDTVAIYGNALSDSDFNYSDGNEGSGSDRVYFSIGLNGYTGPLNTRARVYYQTAPPAWMTEMFEYETEEILSFKEMFENADRSPFLVAEARLDSVSLGINEPMDVEFNVYPNPSSGIVNISARNYTGNFQVYLYSLSGSLIKNYLKGEQIQLPEEQGVYILRIILDNNQESIRRVVKY
jgi:hypothetical protein